MFCCVFAESHLQWTPAASFEKVTYKSLLLIHSETVKKLLQV